MQLCTHDARPRHFLPHFVMSVLKFVLPFDVQIALSASFVHAVASAMTGVELVTQPCATAHETRADVAASGLAPAQPSMHDSVVHARAQVTFVLHSASARHADACDAHFDSAH